MRSEGVGVRLLIVEDDPDIRESLGELLAAEGFVVSVAENGRSALDHLAMPVMTGEEFRVAQLADERLAAIPIVIMSAARDLTQTGERLQAAAVLPKPLGIDPLVQSLRKVALR
jgi:CheY-like chemotaxis protein